MLKPIKIKEHQDIVARYVKFVECKKPGGRCTEGQLREIRFLTDLGYVVFVVDTEEMADRLV